MLKYTQHPRVSGQQCVTAQSTLVRHTAHSTLVAQISHSTPSYMQQRTPQLPGWLYDAHCTCPSAYMTHTAGAQLRIRRTLHVFSCEYDVHCNVQLRIWRTLQVSRCVYCSHCRCPVSYMTHTACVRLHIWCTCTAGVQWIYDAHCRCPAAYNSVTHHDAAAVPWEWCTRSRSPNNRRQWRTVRQAGCYAFILAKLMLW